LLAAEINKETNVLTLPDVLAKRYGKVVEFFISLVTIVSFLMLLAGNLVGMGVVTSYLWGISEESGIWIAAVVVWAYTVSGGLFSVAYTDVIQGMVGWYVIGISCLYFFMHQTHSTNTLFLLPLQDWLCSLCLLSDCERTITSSSIDWIPGLYLP